MFDFFLSHNKAEKSWTAQLAAALRARGAFLFIDTDNIKLGDDVVRKLSNALGNARHIVLVLSRGSVASRWVDLELAASVYTDPDASERRILPVLVEDCEIPLLLRRLNHLDARGKTVDEVADLLMAATTTEVGTEEVATSVPPFSLTPKELMPQHADHREIDIKPGRLVNLRCNIATNSPYFRFGFKLLSPNGRIFGDGSIKSQDPNVILHIGRNYWDRPKEEITARDIFFRWYANGLSPNNQKDQKLFRAEDCFEGNLDFSIDDGHILRFAVNGSVCLTRANPPEISRRVVILGWGDGEDCHIDVSDLMVTTK